MVYVGIDVHATALRVTTLNEDGHHESHRYDNSEAGREAVKAVVTAEPATVAVASGAEASEIVEFLRPVVTQVLLVHPTDLFHMFPKDVGKKTLNLARLAHRAAHEANVDRLLTQSVTEIEKLLEIKREKVEGLLKLHVAESHAWPDPLWSPSGHDWMDRHLADMPAKAQQTCIAHLKIIHELEAELLEVRRLTGK